MQQWLLQKHRTKGLERRADSPSPADQRRMLGVFGQRPFCKLVPRGGALAIDYTRQKSAGTTTASLRRRWSSRSFRRRTSRGSSAPGRRCSTRLAPGRRRRSSSRSSPTCARHWKVVDKSAKLLSPIPRLIAKHKLGKNYCQDLYKKVVVKGSVANGKSTGRPKEYGPELWREFEKIHEEIQKQTKFKPRSKAIQARLADKLNHLPCAETIRKYSRKSQKQKLGFS